MIYYSKVSYTLLSVVFITLGLFAVAGVGGTTNKNRGQT
jgi:hypothetical protein